jgi:hypothetical protein
MKQAFFLAFLASAPLPTAFSAPAPQMSYGENPDPVNGVIVPSPITTETSGSLYGPANLLGEAAAASPVPGGDFAIVSGYHLVNGQEADSKLGLYLDFNSVQNPQPIRGTGGQTDPGPSMYAFFSQTVQS